MDYLSSGQSFSIQNKQKNTVTQSMISTVSEAFQFQDFLGQKTTLKDRVPKNKSKLDPSKRIIHFSRQVTEEPPSFNNPLSYYNQSISSSNKNTNTFENYINTRPYQTSLTPGATSSTLFNQSFSLNQNYPNNSSHSVQTSTSYDTLRYLQNNKSQGISSGTNYAFAHQQPLLGQSFPDKTSLQKNKSINKQSYQNTYLTNSKGLSQNYETNQKKTYDEYNKTTNYSYNKESQQQMSNLKKYLDCKVPNYSNSNSNSVPTSNYGFTNKDYSSRSYPNSSYNYRQYESPVQTNYQKKDKILDRSYENFGDYAKDFSSPDIMAILNKRKKISQNEALTGYTTKV